MTAGIILAAGASSRMGRPKALLTYQGETFVGRLRRVLGSVCDPVIVVLGYHAEDLRASAGEPSVLNPDPSRGQLSSLQTGLAAMPTEADSFAFVPVDCPAVVESTVKMLRGELQDALCIPRYRGKRGHPVFASREVAERLMRLAPEDSAKEVIHSLRDRTSFVDVDDAGVLADIDDPAAYQELLNGRAA